MIRFPIVINGSQEHLIYTHIINWRIYINTPKNSFIELYTKVDAGATAEQISEEARQADITSQMDDNDSESDDDSAI